MRKAIMLVLGIATAVAATKMVRRTREAKLRHIDRQALTSWDNEGGNAAARATGARFRPTV